MLPGRVRVMADRFGVHPSRVVFDQNGIGADFDSLVTKAAAETDPAKLHEVLTHSSGDCVAVRTRLPLAGVVPIAPAGFDMPRWIEIIDRDPVVRRGDLAVAHGHVDLHDLAGRVRLAAGDARRSGAGRAAREPQPDTAP